MATENKKRLKLLRDEYKEITQSNNDEHSEVLGGNYAVNDGIPAHLAVPSQEVVTSVLLKKKKEALLDRFT